MSKKKSQIDQNHQHLALIRRQIRKDMRNMFSKQNEIDTEKITSKYVQAHPEENEFITTVVTG